MSAAPAAANRATIVVAMKFVAMTIASAVFLG
jgi:hypothetical protein